MIIICTDINCMALNMLELLKFKFCTFRRQEAMRGDKSPRPSCGRRARRSQSVETSRIEKSLSNYYKKFRKSCREKSALLDAVARANGKRCVALRRAVSPRLRSSLSRWL